MARWIAVIGCLLALMTEARADGARDFILAEPFGGALDDPSISSHVVHLRITPEAGQRKLQISLVFSKQPTKVGCDAGRPCDWPVKVMDVSIAEPDGPFQVVGVTRDKTDVIVSRDGDASEVIEPLLAVLDGATLETDTDGTRLRNGPLVLPLVSADLRTAKAALLLTEMAVPGDRAVMRCFAEQFTALAARAPKSVGEERMERIRRFVAFLGGFSGTATYYDGAEDQDEAVLQTAGLYREAMAVIGGMLFAPHSGPETPNRLWDTAVSDPVVEANLSAEGERFARSIVKRRGGEIVAFRRYAAWLQNDLGGLQQDAIRERLCESIVPPYLAD